MPLCNNFVFSAHNLQDYLNCQRKFRLKHLLKLEWPAVINQPVLEMEQQIKNGYRFHKMLHQFFSGIPAKTLRDSIDDPTHQSGFDSCLNFISSYIHELYFSELRILMPFKNYRLISVFDFIAFQDNQRIWIVDWKTTAHPPKRDIYLSSIQTTLYSFLAFETRKDIFPESEKLKPENLNMAYWFPNFPEGHIIVDYSTAKHESGRKFLSSLVDEIAYKEPDTFEKTSDIRSCAVCQYRSLCERGSQAGSINSIEFDPEEDVFATLSEFDSIDEIAF